MLTRLKSLVFLALIGLSTFAIPGGIPEEMEQLPDGESGVQQLLQPMESLSARFSQTIYAEDGYVIQKTEGYLQVARPGKIRWISEAPMEQWVIADGETLWIYDPDLEQVNIRPFQKDLAKTPAILFVGDLENLGGSYKVRKEQLENGERYHLYPVGEDSLYTKLALDFYQQKPVGMGLWDTLGQHTEVVFSEQQVNPELDETLFTFEPPPDVDVLRDEEL